MAEAPSIPHHGEDTDAITTSLVPCRPNPAKTMLRISASLQRHLLQKAEVASTAAELSARYELDKTRRLEESQERLKQRSAEAYEARQRRQANKRAGDALLQREIKRERECIQASLLEQRKIEQEAEFRRLVIQEARAIRRNDRERELQQKREAQREYWHQRRMDKDHQMRERSEAIVRRRQEKRDERRQELTARSEAAELRKSSATQSRKSLAKDESKKKLDDLAKSLAQSDIAQKTRKQTIAALQVDLSQKSLLAQLRAHETQREHREEAVARGRRLLERYDENIARAEQWMQQRKEDLLARGEQRDAARFEHLKQREGQLNEQHKEREKNLQEKNWKLQQLQLDTAAFRNEQSQADALYAKVKMVLDRQEEKMYVHNRYKAARKFAEDSSVLKPLEDLAASPRTLRPSQPTAPCSMPPSPSAERTDLQRSRMKSLKDKAERRTKSAGVPSSRPADVETEADQRKQQQIFGIKRAKCGLCEMDYVVDNLPGVVTHATVRRLRDRWRAEEYSGERERGWLRDKDEPSTALRDDDEETPRPRRRRVGAGYSSGGGPSLPPAQMYSRVRLCVFCFQFVALSSPPSPRDKNR
ncbi:unnamed protein product [Vitrella brassicaformis CCMP3155]|uniref:Uncharacterized protein n=3 Tax=Vitrella brassicaformis TaxID=1169539 RepID=A0A0G4EJ76_VITBC|nr:unnamed protein product [Vitrella brassicaformis CCMP3155]|eukprot:CEL96758.1 unnamed protein product [Vitrella brassicaformis CCMP3155]